MHQLLRPQRHNHQMSLSLTSSPCSSRTAPKSKIFHQVRSALCIQSHSYPRGRWMEYCLLHNHWALRISCYAVRACQQSFGVPVLHQWCVQRHVKSLGHLYWWHLNLLGIIRGPYQTCSGGLTTSYQPSAICRRVWVSPRVLPLPALRCTVDVRDGSA